MAFTMFVATLLAGDVKPAAVDKGELKKLQGQWAVTRREHGGKADDPKVIKGLRVEFAGNKWTVRDGDDVAEEGEVVALDAKGGTIDLKLTKGDDKGKVVRGLYKKADKALRVCFAEPDKARPKKFAAEEGTGHTLLYLEPAAKK